MQKLVKLCGIKSASNFNALADIDLDMIGLNFYEPSVRYIDKYFDLSLLHYIPDHVKKVGVFVNEAKKIIIEKSLRFDLDYVQLHGNESAKEAAELSNEGLKVIKAFQVNSNFNWTDMDRFEDCHYYLFDNKSKNFGGSGEKFNWNLIQNYTGSVPFLLSGGIGPDDLQHISEFQHEKYIGIDINSLFEFSPGLKNMQWVRNFVENFKELNS